MLVIFCSINFFSHSHFLDRVGGRWRRKKAVNLLGRIWTQPKNTSYTVRYPSANKTESVFSQRAEYSRATCRKYWPPKRFVHSFAMHTAHSTTLSPALREKRFSSTCIFILKCFVLENRVPNMWHSAREYLGGMSYTTQPCRCHALLIRLNSERRVPRAWSSLSLLLRGERIARPNRTTQQQWVRGRSDRALNWQT